jgi:anthranilate/para-aminobenzoate synthase component I
LTPFKLQSAMKADLNADQYRQAIERIQQYIQAGDCYQVNFAQRFARPAGRSMDGLLRIAGGMPDAVFRLPEPAGWTARC